MKQWTAPSWMKFFWLGLCCAVAVLGSIQLYLQFLPLSSLSTRERSVASLYRAEGEVRYRPSATLTWHSIVAGFPLQVGDAISTDATARAELVWHTGERLNLPAGTMFVIPPDLRGLTVPPPLLDMPNPRLRDVAGKRDR